MNEEKFKWIICGIFAIGSVLCGLFGDKDIALLLGACGVVTFIYAAN